MPKRVYPCIRFLFMAKTVQLNRKDVKNGSTSCWRRGRVGPGGVLNRCLGREVQPGRSNPDPV